MELSELLTPELKIALIVVIVLIVLLWILAIIWTARDAYRRDANWKLWGIIAIIPIIGVVAYCLMRPPLYQIDRDEQELEIAIKQRELMKYGECGNCGYPVEADYVMCPNCHERLKNLCPTCHHALDPTWGICPYCTTKISDAPAAAGRTRTRRTSSRRTAERTVAMKPDEAIEQETEIIEQH